MITNTLSTKSHSVVKSSLSLDLVLFLAIHTYIFKGSCRSQIEQLLGVVFALVLISLCDVFTCLMHNVEVRIVKKDLYECSRLSKLKFLLCSLERLLKSYSLFVG